jgi:L-arabinonolactonase
MALRIEKLPVPTSVLGEGTVWSQNEQCLYYVDIVSGRLQAYWPDRQRHQAWAFEGFVGSLAECKSGGLILALADRIVRFDPRHATRTPETLVVLEADRPHNRLNDGKADPWGRFWVGSMKIDETARTGRLWCITPQGEATLQREEIGVTNSLAFDRTRERLYFADSMRGVIEHAALDGGAVAPQSRVWKPFAPATKASPDGSCTDAAGYLWNAEWGGWRIARHTPDGKVDRIIDMPVSRPSCCTFGGVDLKTLFVTSAHYNMSAAERANDADAGSLYRIEFDDDTQGLPADLFAL